MQHSEGVTNGWPDVNAVDVAENHNRIAGFGSENDECCCQGHNFYKEDFYSMKGSILLSVMCSVPSAKMSTEEVVLYYVLYCTGFITYSFLL